MIINISRITGFIINTLISIIAVGYRKEKFIFVTKKIITLISIQI